MKTRFLRPGWLVIYALLIWFLVSKLFGGPATYKITDDFTLEKGSPVASLYDTIDMGWLQTIQLKRSMKEHAEVLSKVQEGIYLFSGDYTVQEIVDVLAAGPEKADGYNHLTVLEGWSMYDIDDFLLDKGYIEKGAYIDFVSDQEIIARYGERYAFIKQALSERDGLLSLEGYLYPDTYFIDPEKNVLDQLLYLQLESFRQKVREPYGNDLLSLTSTLKNKGYNFRLSTYGALILASIIEKEERYGPNRPIIASVFYNRLDNDMRIDADISLCYGLKQGYEACTPTVIVQNLKDTTNPYNTRAVGGLPPGPIVSPAASSVSALIEAKKTNDFFYLHDNTGQIHTAENLPGHNINKAKYLQ